ncbi:MAG: zinc ribbon domain-containing protein [Deltaproteobacteria bacterium]|nr:zinc ribbon domain-containing protein [Deltaproteobacteria bacterium]
MSSDVQEYLSRAHDAERRGDSEKAGDLFLTAWRIDPHFVGASFSCVIENYVKARNIQKLRSACEEAVWKREFYLRDGIKHLKERGELEAFVTNVATSRQGPDLPPDERGGLFSLLDTLLEVHQASQAAALMLRFWRACVRDVSHSDTVSLFKLEKAVERLLGEGNSQKAIELVRTVIDKLATVPGFSHENVDHYWWRIGKGFLSAKAKREAAEFYRFYFTIKPTAVLDHELVDALRELGEWQGVLDHVLKTKPLEVGLPLSLRLYKEFVIPFHGRKKEGGELEAAALLRCYDAVGPQKYKHPGWGDEKETPHWLETLNEFWKTKGDEAKAEELNIRYWQDKERLETGRIDDPAEAAYSLADKRDFRQAAQEMEKAAIAVEGNHTEYPAGFWYQAAKLYERARNQEQAAQIYEEIGRTAKANRLRGDLEYDLDEAKNLVEVMSFSDHSYTAKVLEAANSSDSLFKAQTAISLLPWWRLTKRREGLIWGDWNVVPALYAAAQTHKDLTGYREALRRIGERYRNRGRWVFAAKIYLFGGIFDDFDRVCTEEDELEVAALWYQQAKMPERAAKIYDLMGQSEKSGKAQTKGAKQRPQETAEPKSDSGEESDRSDFEQLVCPQCGAEIKPHWTVCPKCDADLQQRKCRNCGEPLEPDWQRCPVCRTILKH